jgi:Tfp pilus assembly protein FimT
MAFTCSAPSTLIRRAQRRSVAKSRGISVVELLIGVALCSIVGALVYGSGRSFGAGFALRGEIEALTRLLQELHLRAITSGVRQQLTVSRTGWTVPLALESDTTRGDSVSTRRVHRYDERVECRSAKDAEVELLFFPSGATSPRTIVLQSENRVGRVTVSLRGRVSVSID